VHNWSHLCLVFTVGSIHAFSLYFFLVLIILYPAVRYSLLAHQYLIRSERSMNSLTQFLIHVHISIHTGKEDIIILDRKPCTW
jgi:hypothetical protein